MPEDPPAIPKLPEPCFTKVQEWLSAFSKEAYSTYSKIDTINDRVRTLTPPMTALGAGFIYETSQYSYQNSASDALLFYLPIGAGSILIISAIFLILWALTVKNVTAVLPDAETVFQTVSTAASSNSLDFISLEMQAVERRCTAAAWNSKKLHERGNLLYYGAWLAIAAFGLLIFSTPKFIHNQVTKKTHEQR